MDSKATSSGNALLGNAGVRAKNTVSNVVVVQIKLWS
jgi:hypothetical protein